MFISEYKKCNGFTLIEIIVTIAILSIVSTTIFSMFTYNTNIFQSSNKQFNAQSNARISIDYITKETRYATDLAIISVSTCKNDIANKTIYNNKHYNYIYLENGSINQAIYNTASSQYTTKTIINSISNNGTSFTKINDSTLGIYITGKDGTKTYTINSNIVLSNFALITPTPTIQDGPDLAIRYCTTLPSGIQVSSITVSSSTNSITTANGTLQMIADVLPNDAGNKNVAWSVNDESLAMINSSGQLTAKKNGTVKVTAAATDGSGVTGISNDISITNQQVLVSSITLTGEGDSTVINTNNGTTLKISAAVLPSNAANKTFTWSVSNTDIATIDSNGLLTAKVTNGTVTVAAVANDLSGVTGTLDVIIGNQELSITGVDSCSVTKGTNFTIDLYASGGSGEYSTTFSVDDKDKFDKLTVSKPDYNNKITITGDAPSGNGKSCTIKVTLIDSKKNTVSKTITITTI